VGFHQAGSGFCTHVSQEHTSIAQSLLSIQVFGPVQISNARVASPFGPNLLRMKSCFIVKDGIFAFRHLACVCVPSGKRPEDESEKKRRMVNDMRDMLASKMLGTMVPPPRGPRQKAESLHS